ncbi:unnamed protein product [Auanema sp. JU1783]|nr:unnamed protein product [Auanema sp. JU1783]
MSRKAGGLAAIMAGQPLVKKPTFMQRMRKLFRATGLHFGLCMICIAYAYVGAIVFQSLEYPYEEIVRKQTDKRYKKLMEGFINDLEQLMDQASKDDDHQLNSSLYLRTDEYTKVLFSLFDNPISLNYFDSIFYNKGDYIDLWTMDSAILFTSTTIIPVGFGLITPLTTSGRFFLCLYAIIGIPLALVTMSDIGKFCCDAAFRCFHEKMFLFMVTLLLIIFLYPIFGGLIIHLLSDMTVFDSIYFCSITILTVGYGDIGPPVPVIYLILFIVIGVTLVTISVDVVAANIIHHIHYMGRHMGKAKMVATKMMQMAQKISINKGLGLGMAQLGAFARMGMMMNVNVNAMPGDAKGAINDTHIITDEANIKQRTSTAFDPELDFDLIDHGTRADTDGFAFFDDADNDAFY